MLDVATTFEICKRYNVVSESFSSSYQPLNSRISANPAQLRQVERLYEDDERNREKSYEREMH
jgi:hypothetical protein